MEQENYCKSPLTQLILVIICLALAGSIVAGFLYATVNLPSQTKQQTSHDQYTCSQCAPDLSRCTEICKAQSCYTRCQAQYKTCNDTCT